MAFDYITRQKVGGINFNNFISKQLPVINPDEDLVDDFHSVIKSPYLDRPKYEAFFFKHFGYDRKSLEFALSPTFFDKEYPSETFRQLEQSEVSIHGRFKLAEEIIKEFENE